jgi:hypothetical protein
MRSKDDEGERGRKSPGSEPAPEGRNPTHPPPGNFLEWPVPRIGLEVVLGAAGGAFLAMTLPGARPHLVLFVGIGATAAPIALLLTPRRVAPGHRALRYGVALAVVASLAASFVAGAEALLLEELLGLGILILGVGAAGHLCLALSLDRGAAAPTGDEREGRPSDGGGP